MFEEGTMALRIMTFSITSLIITTVNIPIKHVTLSITIVNIKPFDTVMLSVTNNIKLGW